MVNKIRFILVILMGVVCLAGCSADKEALDPCPYGFSDWTGGASDLGTEMLKDYDETLGEGKETLDEWTRDPTDLEDCIKAICRKDAKCIEKELARAENAWLWSIIDFFAVQHWNLIIMIMLTFLILKWRMPYPERWYHNAALWTFLTYFVLLLLIAIFIRGDSQWATVFWWLSLIILTFILIRNKYKQKSASELEYEEEEEDVGTQDIASESCPLCGGSQCNGRYCEKGLGLLPGYEEEE